MIVIVHDSEPDICKHETYINMFQQICRHFFRSWMPGGPASRVALRPRLHPGGRLLAVAALLEAATTNSHHWITNMHQRGPMQVKQLGKISALKKGDCERLRHKISLQKARSRTSSRSICWLYDVVRCCILLYYAVFICMYSLVVSSGCKLLFRYPFFILVSNGSHLSDVFIVDPSFLLLQLLVSPSQRWRLQNAGRTKWPEFRRRRTSLTVRTSWASKCFRLLNRHWRTWPCTKA